MNRVASADNSDAMSLFPFLAVLLCTMGALIVLLVVVAHQSRLQASQEAAMPPPEAGVKEDQYAQSQHQRRQNDRQVEHGVGQKMAGETLA